MGYTIYLRTNLVNGKQYVGQTGNFRRREKAWGCTKLGYANWYLNEEREKYGLENFDVSILAEVDTQEESWELEQNYIEQLGTKYPDGYNMSDGGTGPKNVYRPEEFRQKISEKQMGNNYPYK